MARTQDDYMALILSLLSGLRQRGQLRHSLVRGVPSLDCTRRLRVPTLSIPTLLSSAQECSQGGAKTSFPTSQSFILIAGRAGEFQVIKVIWPY